MKWIARLERRFGRFAIPNVTLAIILGQILVYVAGQMPGNNVVDRLWLFRDRVLEGEVWRLVTFIFMPPATNPLFALLAWYLFFLMGSALERFWGVFRYNVYLLIGLLAAMVVGMSLPGGLPFEGSHVGSSGYIMASVFLAFAFLYPDFTLSLFFVLPIRIYWLALITWVLLGASFLFGQWADRAMVVATVLNFLIFFGGDLMARLRNRRRRRAFESRVKAGQRSGQPRHRCAVCGLTSHDDPKMQFRYCSQCAGQLCYCMDHLRDHEHVTADDAAEVAAGKKDE
jgi:hypothetical protein